jgi:hypothetical protein
MKRYLKLIFVFLSICYVKGYSQCNNPVCGLYGDANGNSNWNWELTDANDPNYCKQWLANTGGSTPTSMGSPFVNSPTSGLDIISQNKDFTKAKGWELIQRDFGCSRVTAYPYFILYNKYSGLMRIFVYQAGNQQYSSVLIQIQPTKNPYPATTSLGDSLVVTPDKYLNSGTGTTFGKSVLAVSENGGNSRWSLAEFLPGFDPNIQNSIYSGAGLQFTVYGVTTNTIAANIKGRSVTSTDPQYGLNFSPKNPPGSTDGQTFNFKADGEKFVKFGKTITDVRNKVNSAANDIVNSISNPVTEVSLPGRIKAAAAKVRDLTESDDGFGKTLGTIASLVGGAGNVLSFIGNVVGLFSGGSAKPAAMPTYTSYDLVLSGTITAKLVAETFIIRVPGTVQPDNNNATYYKCPVGIFNIKNTPQAGKISYKRIYKTEWYPNSPPVTGASPRFTDADYVSYKMQNDLAVSFNSGAGLDLVSVQAAIVGEVLAGSDGNAAYDLLAEHVSQDVFLGQQNIKYTNTVYNYMLPDLQAGRLEMTVYDPVKKLHTFQTPYVNIECLNGLVFNARKETNVFLRVRAVLKKTNDPDNTPIYYIRDYNIQTFDVALDPGWQTNYEKPDAANNPTPWANYTELPLYISDKTINSVTYNSPTEVDVDNSITTQNGVDVIVPSGQSVVYKAGAVVDLQDGFHAQAGSEFSAVINKFGYNITCGTPSTEAFVYPGNCYNSSITALRAITHVKPDQQGNAELKIYPTPTSGNLVISGMKNYKDAMISIIDESGRYVQQIKTSSSTEGGTINLNVSSLDNGVYFIKIQNQAQITTKKIVVNK